MRNTRSRKPMVESPQQSQSVLLTPAGAAAMLQLPERTLTNWRAADTGISYIQLSYSSRASVRYLRKDLIEWQRSRRRVVPTDWPSTEALPVGDAPDFAIDVAWLTPKQVAIKAGIPTRTLWAWRCHQVGLPFIAIGNTIERDVMYYRSDVDAFIARRAADPSIVPVIPRKGYVRDTRTPEQRRSDRAHNKAERDRINARIWKDMGYSDEVICRRLGTPERRSKGKLSAQAFPLTRTGQSTH